MVSIVKLILKHQHIRNEKKNQIYSYTPLLHYYTPLNHMPKQQIETENEN